MKKMMLAIAITLIIASCTMPVAVEKDNSATVGKKNAELLQEKINETGAALHAIHVVLNDQPDIVLDSFSIEGIYLVDNDHNYVYNLTEMISLSVEEITYSAQNKIIRIQF